MVYDVYEESRPRQTLLTGLAVMSVDNADTAARAASTSDTGQL